MQKRLNTILTIYGLRMHIYGSNLFQYGKIQECIQIFFCAVEGVGFLFNMQCYIVKTTLLHTAFFYRYSYFLLNSFQIIFTYNDHETFIIGNYDRLDNAGAAVAFNDKCFQSLVPPSSSNKLATHSNVGVKGRHVWELNVAADCARSKFHYYVRTSLLAKNAKKDGASYF